jgi:hypothetical protein
VNGNQLVDDTQSVTIQTFDSKHSTEYEIPGVSNTGSSGGTTDPGAPTLGDSWGLLEEKVWQFINWLGNLNPTESE